MSTLTESTFRRLQKEHEEAQQSASRAEGALQQLMRQLKTEFGCDTLEQAQEKLTELQTQKDKMERIVNKRLQAYEEKWKTGEE